MKTQLAVALIALTASVAAHAFETVNLTGYTHNPGGLSFDPANAITKNSVGAVIPQNPPIGLYAGAGLMSGFLNGASFVAYCAEINQNITFGVDYTNYTLVGGVSALGAAKAENLAKLVTWAGLPTNAAQSAAFQSAVWEILYEPGSGYSFSVGPIMATSDNASTEAALNAVSWATVATTVPSYTVSILSSSTGQDLLVFIPAVPEVGSMAMLTLGLLGIGLASRRRAV